MHNKGSLTNVLQDNLFLDSLKIWDGDKSFHLIAECFKKVSNNLNSFEIMYFAMVTFCVEMMTCVSPYGYIVISVIITIKYSTNDIYLINEF